jgi:hypothetical protein
MAQQQRKISNMLVQPKFQLKLSFVYMFVGGLILSVVGLVVLQITSSVEALMNNNPVIDFRVQGQINGLMLQCVQASLLGFGVFILFSFVFALVVSHRVDGSVSHYWGSRCNWSTRLPFLRPDSQYDAGQQCLPKCDSNGSQRLLKRLGQNYIGVRVRITHFWK